MCFLPSGDASCLVENMPSIVSGLVSLGQVTPQARLGKVTKVMQWLGVSEQTIPSQGLRMALDKQTVCVKTWLEGSQDGRLSFCSRVG